MRRLTLIEGVSFLLLLGIAMPLKYVWERPEAVKYVGWAHGLLFVALCFALLRTMVTVNWSFVRAAMVFVASLLPFGPFVLDWRMKEWEKEEGVAEDATGFTAEGQRAEGAEVLILDSGFWILGRGVGSGSRSKRKSMSMRGGRVFVASLIHGHLEFAALGACEIRGVGLNLP